MLLERKYINSELQVVMNAEKKPEILEKKYDLLNILLSDNFY